MAKAKGTLPENIQYDRADSGPRFEPQSLKDFLSTKQKERPWLLKDLLPREAYILVSGQQKRAMKTLLSMAMSTAVASGKEVGNITAPEKPEKVLFVVQEGTRFGLANRWGILLRSANATKDTQSRIDVSYMERVYLDKDAWRDRLVSYVAENNYSLVVLDPLARLRSGDSNENSAGDSQRIMETIDAIKELGPATLLLAHLDKAGGRDPKADCDDQVRGSGHLTASYDLHFALRRYNKADKGIDLTIRDREADDRAYRVLWSFEGDPTRVAYPFLIPKHWTDGIIPYELFAKTLNGDGRYPFGMLKSYWGLGTERTHMVVDGLIEEGYLERSEEGSYRLQ